MSFSQLIRYVRLLLLSALHSNKTGNRSSKLLRIGACLLACQSCQMRFMPADEFYWKLLDRGSEVFQKRRTLAIDWLSE